MHLYLFIYVCYDMLSAQKHKKKLSSKNKLYVSLSGMYHKNYIDLIW